MATGGVPIRYFPLLYAGFAAVALFIIFLIANRLHFHVAVTTHCSTKLTIEQEASFRNWRWDSEFLPSISSASGDHLPERPLWRIALACAVGFLVVGHYHAYLLYRKGDGARPGFTLSHAFLVSLVAKVVSGFGYNFIASFEHWTFHTYSFAVYIFCGFAMQLIHVALTRRYQHLIPNNQGAISLRTKTICLVGQTLCAAGVGKFFVLDHVGACIHGAYSRSNMCEWTFSLFNLAFDATVYFDLGDQRLVTTCSGAGGGDDEKESITAGATNTTTTVPNLLPSHVGTWRSWPSQGLLWAADVAAAYFAVSGLIQMLKQVYFIPMVAMRFTPEAIMGVTLPVATLIATRIPAVRSVLMPASGDKSLSDLIALQRWIVVVTICAAFALFHADILISAEMKIVVSGIAPHLLFAVFRLRALCVSSKAATLGKIAEGADRHDVNTEALVSSVVHEQHRLAYSMGFGFVGCMAARFWGLSLDPLMIDPIWNAYFLVGFVVLQFAGPLRQYSVELIALNRQHVPLVPATASSMSAAAAFGFLLGLSLMVASSSETTARYVGVDPLGDWWAPPATILAVLGGVVFSERLALLGASAMPKRSAFTALCAAMSLGALVLYYGTTQSDWYYQMNPRVLEKWALKPRSGSPAFAFLGGLVLQFCIGALWPRVFAWHMGLSQTVVADSIQAAAALEHHHHDSPALLSAPKVDTVAYLCNASVLVGNIYCAVFPFVPGGFLMRNRMDIVLFGAVFGVLVFVSRLAQSTESGAVRVTSRGATPRVSTVGRLFAGVVLLLVIGRQLAWEDAPDPTVVTPDGHSSVNVTGAIWTIHFTDDDYGVDSLPRMIKMLKEHKPNIIGFLESDAHRVVSANRDITMHVAYQMGYRYSDYGPTSLDGTFGCAMISQFPIEEVERMVLPSPLGELACMIRAKVRVLPSPAPLVNVYVGHWGNTQHVQDVVLQSEVLRDMALKYAGPSFFLGYLVTAPGHRNYYRFVQSDGVEEDAVMNRGGEDDDTKVWPEERDGIRLPQIPIVKKRDTLFRDAGRDLNRGRNPFFRGPITPQQHAAQRSRDDKELAGATWAPSLYWRVHAIPKDYTDKSIALEGRVASRELQQQYVVTQLDAAALANLRTGRHENGTVVYGGNAKSARELHLERLQRAAEYKARHLTLTDGLEIKPDPAKLREFAAEYELLEKEMKLVYEFPNTGRVQMRHPRREYDDRYCQYILYRSIPLLDWYRVLNMDEISDTELMVVRFSMSTDPNFAATSAVALAEKP